MNGHPAAIIRILRNRIPQMACAACLLLSAGCYKVRAVPVKQIEEYPSRQTIGKVTCAVEPFDASASREVFHHPVNSKDFLPVLVLVQNNESGPVTVSGGDIRLQDARGRIRNRAPAKAAAAKFERLPGVEAFLFFGLLSFMDANDYNDKLHADWQNKELANRLVVEPHSTAYGFAFFPFDDDEDERAARITVPVIAGRNGYHEIELPLR